MPCIDNIFAHLLTSKVAQNSYVQCCCCCFFSSFNIILGHIHFHIGDSSIASASQAWNLGAIFDSSMTMKPQISNVIRSSTFQLRNISRIRKYLNRDATEQIIHSLITSRLDNNCALLYGLPANQLYRLQKFKILLLASITFSRKSCHITPISKELHWFPVTQRIVFKLLLIVYKCTHNIAPSFFFWTPLTIFTNAYASLRQQATSSEAKSNRSWGDGSFAIAAPRLWNELPFNIRTAKSIIVFKKKTVKNTPYVRHIL